MSSNTEAPYLADALARRAVACREVEEFRDPMWFVKAATLANLAVAIGARPRAASATPMDPPGSCTVWGEGATAATPATAARNNAWKTHSRAQDDTFAQGACHLGSAVMPAVFATAEHYELPPSDVCAGLLAGYEVGAAASHGVGGLAGERGLRSSAVFGPLAAAAACAVSLGLEVEAVASAIRIAGAGAGGFCHVWFDGGELWGAQVGFASQLGVEAALHAAGPLPSVGGPSLECPHGLYDSIGAAPDERAWSGLPDLCSTDITLKPFPVCEVSQGMAGVLVECDDVKDARRIDVALNELEAGYVGILSSGPFSGRGEALLSAPLCAAIAVRDRAVTLDALDAACVDVPDLSNVRVHADPDLAVGSCRVTVTRADGSTFTVERHAQNAASFEVADRVSKLIWDECGLEAPALSHLRRAVMDLDSTPVATLLEVVDSACRRRADRLVTTPGTP